MKLRRIYSSKVYVTSTRKDKIRAAIQDPFNQELVQQLSEYLDDEGTIELKQAIAEQKSEEPTSSESDSDGGGFSTDDSTFSGGGGGSHPSFTGNIVDDFGGDDLADIEPLPEDEGGEASPEPTPDEPIEETTYIQGKSVTATSLIWTTIEDVVNECDVIKGTLNAREDTKGANRLQVKDNELWIYFNDDVNLNDKMIDVIEVLNSTGYTYLAFSRLARSNNAIVFDINLNTSDIKPEEAVEDEN